MVVPIPCIAPRRGGDGVAPPGPTPNDMDCYLQSPTMDLSTYEEVYLELWFYAKNDSYSTTFYDKAQIGIVNSGRFYGVNLGVVYDSDCTTDPTTENGWRRVLYRVHDTHRIAGAAFRIRFDSNSSNQFEGTYIDDIRIVATADVDTEPLANDTYSARLHGLKNTGQIAALGTDANDLQISLSEAWDLVTVDSSVVVAVIDDGVDLSHPDLNLVTGYDPWGAEGGDARGDHGTACAGLVGAIADNTIGVVGTAPNVSIMPVYTGPSEYEYGAAIDLAVAHGADILSNSWGFDGYASTVITTAVNDALAAGKVVLFSAGNGPDRAPWTYKVAFPGALSSSTDLICVGASGPTDEHKSASSSDGLHEWGSSYLASSISEGNAYDGDGPDVVAPGTWIYTTDRQGADGYNGGYPNSIDADYTHNFEGTSASCPMVAGIAALLLSANPDLNSGQVKRILKNTADDIEEPGEDDKTGAGRVNAWRAVKSLSTMDAHSSPQTDRTLGASNDTETEKMSVLKFRISDHGEDSLSTLIDRIVVEIGGSGGAAGSDIAWAELVEGGSRLALATSITDSEITFGSTPESDNSASLSAITDNSYKEYTVNIYFNSTLTAAHGETYTFDVDESKVGLDLGTMSSLIWKDTEGVAMVTGTIDNQAMLGGDFDQDGDVDGKDLGTLCDDPMRLPLSDFSDNYGKP